MELDIQKGFYRVSIKALILDETRTKFILTQEKSGKWELPGGGIDQGELPEECLRREIKEEMGLSVTSIKKSPSYFLTGQRDDGKWAAYVIYETAVLNLNFTPSDECMALQFVAADDVKIMDAFKTVQQFALLFDPANHIKV